MIEGELHGLAAQVSDILASLRVEPSTPETDLFETGLVDSLTLVELLLQLEERLGVRISVEDIEPDNFRSIRAIASFVTSSRADRAAS